MSLHENDAYVLTVGDEMRGHRATFGLTLDDVAVALRVRPGIVAAIETGDLDAFPNRYMIAGLVRAYARLLGMDDGDSYRRFCRQTGYISPALRAAQGALVGHRHEDDVDPMGRQPDMTQSRFLPKPAARRMPELRLAGLASVLATVSVVAGISYSASEAVQRIQQLNVAVPLAAETIMPARAAAALDPVPARPDPSAYAEGGTLAPVRARRETTPVRAFDPALFGTADARVRSATRSRQIASAVRHLADSQFVHRP